MRLGLLSAARAAYRENDRPDRQDIMLLRSSPPSNMPKMRRSWRVKLIILGVLAAGYGAFMWHMMHSKPPVIMQRVLIPVEVVKKKEQAEPKGPPAPPIPLIQPPQVEIPAPVIKR